MTLQRPPHPRQPVGGATMQVETPSCMVCGRSSWLTVPVAGYTAWKQGAFIQTALPDLTASQREQLKTGTHEECWTAMVGPED